MKLTEEHVDALVTLAAAPDRRERFAEQLRERPLDDWRVLIDENGDVRSAVAIAQLGSGFYMLRRLFVRAGDNSDVGTRVVAEAVAEARSRGARRMRARVFETRRTDDYEHALRTAGFVCQSLRVEFKTPLDELPMEGDTPIAWRTSSDVVEAALMLDAVAVGNPDQADDEDATEFIVAHTEDRDTDARIEIGAVDGKDVAFLLAEVEPKLGWSTLSYFGITPDARGRGLGVVAHRHGIATMRAMGGKLYHGGCWLENAAMVRTFAANGCREFARMTDWMAVFDSVTD